MNHSALVHVDPWSAFVLGGVHKLDNTCDAITVIDAMGVAGVFVMSEEWWDPSIRDMHPRIAVAPIPALLQFRQRQLKRLTVCGISVQYTWVSVDQFGNGVALYDAVLQGAVVGLYGITGLPTLYLSYADEHRMSCQLADGTSIDLDSTTIRAPSGIQCLVFTRCEPVRASIHDAMWLQSLLHGMPSIAFDTPRHPLRDWQVWHVGIDALAVAALSAETAAPLAIVSDNVARILHSYAWRVEWLLHQLHRMHSFVPISTMAQDACADAQFYLGVLTQQYPVSVARRSLTLPEGALIAEACRDTRQALRVVMETLVAPKT